MQGRIRYILYVLLFVLTGILCGLQSISQPGRGLSYIDASHLQQPTTPSNDTRHYDHTMLAPEITGSCSVTHFDQKAAPLHPVTAIHRAAQISTVFQTLFRRSADLHPHPVAYYVFSLGKIVI